MTNFGEENVNHAIELPENTHSTIVAVDIRIAFGFIIVRYLPTKLQIYCKYNDTTTLLS